MGESYNYSVSADFPNGQVNPSVLSAEILDSSITTALLGINLNGDDCEIAFEGPLSPTEQSTLDVVVSNHQGEQTTSDLQYEYSENVESTTETSWQDKLVLESMPLTGGHYLITWYAETKIGAATPIAGAFVRLTFNGSERGISVNDLTQWVSFSGSAVVNLAAGKEPILAVQYRVLGGANEANIRRVRLAIAPVEME